MSVMVADEQNNKQFLKQWHFGQGASSLLDYKYIHIYSIWVYEYEWKLCWFFSRDANIHNQSVAF
jgi:hypothetical protein